MTSLLGKTNNWPSPSSSVATIDTMSDPEEIATVEKKCPETNFSIETMGFPITIGIYSLLNQICNIPTSLRKKHLLYWFSFLDEPDMLVDFKQLNKNDKNYEPEELSIDPLIDLQNYYIDTCKLIINGKCIPEKLYDDLKKIQIQKSHIINLTFDFDFDLFTFADKYYTFA